MVSVTYSFEDADEISDGVFSTGIEGLYFIPHKEFYDDRGMYAELSRIPEIEAVTGKPFNIKQTNLAVSVNNVARGFHAEDWNKLVSILGGSCFTAIADIRPDSDTFGKVETFVIGQKDTDLKGSLFVSSGLANSLCVLEGPVSYLYEVDQLYQERDKSNDVAISLFDNDLGVEWPIPREQMILSERDRNTVTLREKYPEKF